VVQTAAGVLAYYQGLEAAGTLSREAAQQQALQVVRALRYDQTTTSGSTTCNRR
jgi:methyl-accepting chemotaxis protein